MEWQAIVLTIQILLLVVGWVLFQQARAELSARAAETPVLSEIKALQRNVKQLLGEIESAADQAGERVERRCIEAREIIANLERLEAEKRPVPVAGISAVSAGDTSTPIRMAVRRRPTVRGRRPASDTLGPSIPVLENGGFGGNLKEVLPGANSSSRQAQSRRTVYEMADAGKSTAEIAYATVLSEGEVETLLGLRHQR